MNTNMKLPSFITAEEKLKLIEEPARRAVSQLRILADDNTLGICDEGQCSMSNLASWLEGVLDQKPAYMPWVSESARHKLGWIKTIKPDETRNPIQAKLIALDDRFTVQRHD